MNACRRREDIAAAANRQRARESDTTRPNVAASQPAYRPRVQSTGRSAQRGRSARTRGRPVGAQPREAMRYRQTHRASSLVQRDELRRLLDESESMGGERTEAAVLERVIVRRRVPCERGGSRLARDVVMVVMVMGRVRAAGRRRQAPAWVGKPGLRAGRLLERPRRGQQQARHRGTQCQSDDRDQRQPSPGAKVTTSRTHRPTVLPPLLGTGVAIRCPSAGKLVRTELEWTATAQV
jgi:hypothetical protein